MDSLDPENDRTKYYELFGLPKEASENDIKKTYYKLALVYHPDKNPEGGEKMKDIAKAYAVLSNSITRTIYDNFGEAGLERHEMLEKDSSIVELVHKAWIYGTLACVAVLTLDYYLFGIPLEWVATLFATFYGMYLVPSNQQRGGLVLYLVVADLIIYFITPSAWMHFIAETLIIFVLLGSINTTVSYIDFSAGVLVGLLLLRSFFAIEVTSTTVHLLGAHSISLALVSLLLLFLFFQLQYVKHNPSKVLVAWSYVSPYVSFIPILVLVFYVPVWILDYFIGWPFEWILYSLVCGASLYTNLSKVVFALMIPAAAFIVTVYYFVPETILAYTANFMIIVSLLQIFYIQEATIYAERDKPEDSRRHAWGFFAGVLGLIQTSLLFDEGSESKPKPEIDLAQLPSNIRFLPCYLVAFSILAYVDIYLREVSTSWLLLGAISITFSFNNLVVHIFPDFAKWLKTSLGGAATPASPATTAPEATPTPEVTKAPLHTLPGALDVD